ncbi:MAG: hypothetical protein Q9177_006766 [Variospora cf. flavescens]
MTSTIGIPIKLLNEAQNHVVTLEITSGQVYRGKLIEAEDNMNVQLKDITVTARDGRVSHLDQVYIRGSHVRFFIVPDMLSKESAYTNDVCQERAYVPFERCTRSWCGYGEGKSDSEPGEGPTRFEGWMNDNDNETNRKRTEEDMGDGFANGTLSSHRWCYKIILRTPRPDMDPGRNRTFDFKDYH